MDFFVLLVRSAAGVLDLAIQIYIYILIARALISWVNPDPYNPIVRFLHNATDPVLFRIRKVIPLQFGGIDFSPIVLLLALAFIRNFIMLLLNRMMYGL